MYISSLSRQKLPFFPDGTILKRAAILALIIGTILTFTNQWAAIFGSAQFKILPMVLVFQTPFLVIMISQILGVRQALCEITMSSVAHRGETFFRTMASHYNPEPLTSENAALILIDHQVELMTGIRDYSIAELKHNVVGFAKATRALDIYADIGIPPYFIS